LGTIHPRVFKKIAILLIQRFFTYGSYGRGVVLKRKWGTSERKWGRVFGTKTRLVNTVRPRPRPKPESARPRPRPKNSYETETKNYETEPKASMINSTARKSKEIGMIYYLISIT